MKLNNKGFAITAVLYSLLILFLLLFLSTIKILNTQFNRMKKISDTINDSVVVMKNQTTVNETYSPDTTPSYYTTYARGKYIFTINGGTDEYYVYLPQYTTMEIKDNILTFIDNDENKNEITGLKALKSSDNSELPGNVTSFTITSFYTSGKA